ncbi:MAG TPA: hypothetical protein VLN45_03610 [Ignavibacteriaceae bacterium]|nr:hypothetical protein [Ignavibacteriaceae bacterium]
MKVNISIIVRLVKSFFLLMIVFLSSNCSLTQEQFEKLHWDEKTQGPIPNFVESYIEVFDFTVMQDSGIYYLYTGKDYKEKTINPSNKLRRLYVLGFDIKMAWYRPPLGGCSKPGSNIMYPEFFLIRLSEPNELLEEYNFRIIKENKWIPCAHNVTLYVPEFD